MRTKVCMNAVCFSCVRTFILFFVFCVPSLSLLCCGTWADGAKVSPRYFAPGQANECLAVSPDGKTLAAGGKRVQVFDAATGHCRLNEVSRHGEVLSLAFSPDSALLALGIEDDDASTGRIELRDGHTGRLRRVFKTFGPQDTPAAYLAFSPNGDILAGEGGSEDSTDGYLRLWQVTTGRLKMDVVVDEFTPPLFLPNGKLLVTLNSRDGVRLLSARTGRIVHVLPSRLNLLRIALSPDGIFLAVAGEAPVPYRFAAAKHQIEIWNLRSLTRQRVLDHAPSNLDDMRFDSNDRLLTVEGKLLTDLTRAGATNQEKSKPQKSKFQTAPSVVLLWNINSGIPSPLALGGAAPLVCAFSPDGHFLAVLTQESICLWPVR